ncbi:MAG: hypothetical protein HYW89_01115 [Candidatus Sungiibacteriota bacterium]|uniref:Uncharacterized protein n=1 Tax=Candidatus Sungiibacteriota bacterium TaxID=2750080 RepID=A0A7T5RJZ8_9BACT|nr:MAG: hypothetical protein HYW89_01115 [Candidatus Sungbacteria bacterium]
MAVSGVVETRDRLEGGRSIEAIIRKVRAANEQREKLPERLEEMMESEPSSAEDFLRGVMEGVVALIPIKKVQKLLFGFMDNRFDPLVGAEQVIREWANSLQESALDIKYVEMNNAEEKERLAGVIQDATEGGWDEEELFKYSLDESNKMGLAIDPEVVELLRLRGENMDQEEKDIFAQMILASLQRRKTALEKASRKLSSVSNEILGIIHMVIAMYVEFATLKPSITAHREAARAALGAGRGVFVAGELLIKTVESSHQSLMAAVDVMEVLNKRPVAGRELVERLELADTELREKCARVLGPASSGRLQLEARVRSRAVGPAAKAGGEQTAEGAVQQGEAADGKE